MDARIVLYGPEGKAAPRPCSVTKVDHAALSLVSSVAAPLHGMVRVSDGNKLYLGEVIACRPVDGAFSIEVTIDRFLGDVAEAKQLAARFEMTPVDEGEIG